jgi:hypothetical protein
MSDLLPLGHEQERALDWARAARDAGWLTEHDVTALTSLDLRAPEMLFDSEDPRPLVVALFGGTGVGKSTLLNRLARREVARTGVVRPTSREISVYVHESIRFGSPDTALPLDSVRIARHANQMFRSVFWVDMPDFDSTDSSNRALVLQWLPHIDVVVYVVSPERYRDDRGWRLLLQHERAHAWLFVFNQWDRGHPSQLEDFRSLLRQGGFGDPVLLYTDCSAHADAAGGDQFAQLESLIEQLGAEKAVAQLSAHNHLARMQSLSDAIAMLVRRLGRADSYLRLMQYWNESWKATQTKLTRGLQWAVQELAWRFVQRDGNLLQRPLDLGSSNRSAVDDSPSTNLVWDDWAQLCFSDALDGLVVECQSAELPTAPLQASLQGVRELAPRRVLERCQFSLRDTLSRPGNLAQRVWLKVLGAIAVLAPLLAIGWVAYEVVVEYYESVHDDRPFLGTNFAVHSALLIAVAWLLPYFLHRKLQPSTERTARRGLQTGLRLALDELDRTVADVLTDYRDAAEARRAAGMGLLAELESASTESAGGQGETALGRLLASPERSSSLRQAERKQ